MSAAPELEVAPQEVDIATANAKPSAELPPSKIFPEVGPSDAAADDLATDSEMPVAATAANAKPSAAPSPSNASPEVCSSDVAADDLAAYTEMPIVTTPAHAKPSAEPSPSMVLPEVCSSDVAADDLAADTEQTTKVFTQACVDYTLAEAVVDVQTVHPETSSGGVSGQADNGSIFESHSKLSAKEEAEVSDTGAEASKAATTSDVEQRVPSTGAVAEMAPANLEVEEGSMDAEAVVDAVGTSLEVKEGPDFAAGAEVATMSSIFARTLQALKDEGRELARLHHEAKERAAGRLPALGSLLDAEEDMLEALVQLRGLSPLLLVDGALGTGKSSLINALLLGIDPDDQLATGSSSPSNGSLRARTESSSPTSSMPSSFDPPLRLGRPGGRGPRPLLVRAPLARIEGERRYLEGRPSLGEGSRPEARMRVLSEDEWAERLQGDPVQGSSPTVAKQKAGTAAKPDANASLPLVLEDHRACTAWRSGLWLAEVDIQDDSFLESQWIAGCGDAICLVRATGGGNLGVMDEARVRQHLEAGRQLLLIVNQCDVVLEPPIPSLGEVEELASKAFGSDDISGIHAVSLLRSRCSLSSIEEVCLEAETEAATTSSESPLQRWSTAWTRCQQGVREFAALAEQRRLAEARRCLAQGREAFVHWCAQGAKVVTAATKGFQQDAENVRLARDIINRNIDAEYLAHVFSSVLVGKFDGVCAALAKAPAPDLGAAWGRHATRRAMEEYLSKELEQRLRVAMQESLCEVTAEMAKQEAPAFQEIRRVARRGASVPWDAEVRKLELDLQPDQLQHFAMHFFGSLAVGVLSGLGAAALEMLLAELVLGPVGLVAGVATFVAFGVQTADWPSVREAFIKQVRTRHVELVEKAREQLNFQGLCERRRRRILEQMDIILHRLLAEVAALSESASEFARCALVLQTRQVNVQ